ncbi:MAG: PD-(D/E)XK nuclease family protein [archaeon]
MIKHVSLQHGWFYHYRLHEKKMDLLCNRRFAPLHSFLHSTFDNCPDEHFLNGPRSSKLRFDVGITPTAIENHEVCKLAEEGLASQQYKTAHSNVQMFMLEHDNKTVGVEVPIWLRHQELPSFKRIFDTKDPLSGHIDALRVEDKNVWVWDYKPRAEKERYATTQTYFYALMLSQRTGIPLKKFKCGYFDQDIAFVFDPNKKTKL